MKKIRRLDLRKRHRQEVEMPGSGLLFQIRPLHDSDFIRIWNELQIDRAAAAKPSDSADELPQVRPRRRGDVAKWVTKESLALAQAGYRHMENIHRRACDDAVRDLRAMGVEPSDLRVHAYQYRIGTWTRICDLEAAQVNTLLQLAPADADPAVRRYLPIPEASSPAGQDARTPTLPEERYRRWQSGIRQMVEAGLIHASAIGWRTTFRLLARALRLPSRDIFLGTYLALAQDLVSRGEAIDGRANDVLLGYCAADASKWQLETLRWHLEEVDMLLDPKESYLSLRSEPRKLGIWKEIDFRLRQCFDRSASHLSVSESIAAAVMTYVGSPLFEPAPVRTFAQNIVEKWRLRAKDEEGELKKAMELERERTRRVRAYRARWRRRTNRSGPES